MRFTRVSVKNIGGLQDGTIEIPGDPIIAFAGANGAGKSKLLTCLLSPWENWFPHPRDLTAEARICVTILLSHKERSILESLAREMGWSGLSIDAPAATMEITRMGLSGTVRFNCHEIPPIQTLLQAESFLANIPSLDVVYLPAERRFIPQAQLAVDLTVLTDEMTYQKRRTSRSTSLSGRLDDDDFEAYAKALCFAGSLPSESGSADTPDGSPSKWDEFKSAVDILLHPKSLMPLTRENPTNLRIEVPGGATHAVSELSSGERQALLIASRVFQASEYRRTIIIDEPDAYLHPTLSSKLLAALRVGMDGENQLIVATHSPAILDSVAPSGIIRLYHDREPQVLASEEGRLDLYRAAGFRASTLTQANILVIAEGDFDQNILPKLAPNLAAAGFRGVGGRSAVLNSLASLGDYQLPVIGVVDADVKAPAVPEGIDGICHVWPAADIEGVLLSSDEFLDSAIGGALVNQKFRSIESLKEVLAGLLLQMKNSAVSEIAQRIVRQNDPFDWPTPKGNDPIGRLRAIAGPSPRLSLESLEEAISEAEIIWQNALPDPWGLVRGKWIISKFLEKTSPIRSGAAFLEAVAMRQPQVPAIEDFARRAESVMLA